MENERTAKCPVSLKDEILFQIERLNKIDTAIESARENQGLTDRFFDWVDRELSKVEVSLMATAISVERLEKENDENRL